MADIELGGIPMTRTTTLAERGMARLTKIALIVMSIITRKTVVEVDTGKIAMTGVTGSPNKPRQTGTTPRVGQLHHR
jgi:hypothetical protein